MGYILVDTAEWAACVATQCTVEGLSQAGAHLRPMRPVKQNWQFIAQPTWDDTQTVTRGRLPPRRRTGMSTVSTLAPAAGPAVRENTSFRVPSAAVWTRSSARPPSTETVSLTASLQVEQRVRLSQMDTHQQQT